MASRDTKQTQTLLQRLHDGELEGAHRAEADALAKTPEGAALLGALEEISEAVRVTERIIWEGAEAPEAGVIAATARDHAEDELDLVELAPLLERFHDGEATEEEAELVLALIEEREEVVAYLSSLDEIGESLRVVGDEIGEPVGFDGFFAGVMARLQAEDGEDGEDEAAAEVIAFPGATTRERPAFCAEDHRVLLYRAHDGVATAEELRQVAAWRELDDEVAATLDALEELRLACVVSVEMAQERADLSHLWPNVREALAGELDGKVVALAPRRAEAAAEVNPAPWWQTQRQSVIALAAAVLAVMGFIAYDQTRGPQQIIERKTVVIVDSVESAPNASVMVSAPMPDTGSLQPMTTTGPSIGSATPAAEEPTIIWLIDAEEEPAPAKGDAKPPASKSPATTPSTGRPI